MSGGDFGFESTAKFSLTSVLIDDYCGLICGARATATSLNHAFTLLSQAHEKHRISNTGNVYTRVFDEDRDKRWYPLDDLRIGVQAVGERHLLHGLWAEVEQKLGWRPTPVADRARRRK